ncbi:MULTISPECIES: flagellar assembly protein FliH [Halorhodospira]|uniref:flagellar assembly protein FliH n=1 Tax=Halorhodospira TaxID=85108 RepID=UPI001EE85F0D|nr:MULTISPECIES: flagellar assembly protein FliH [Halorhodospira]MCG5528813.1 flagellar assembly protein FliH [Halorhodospira halophila]MCG5543276.1 flagellar assembly protein FliH [Halorhodospira sp. 9628]
MDSGDRRLRIIPGEFAETAEAWETPDFDQPEIDRQRQAEQEQARRIEREKRRRRRERRRQAVAERLRLEDEARRSLPTVEEIEEIRATARRQGHQEGYEAGRHEGFHAGYPEGLQAGQSDGRRAGAVLVRRLRALLDTLGRPLEQLDRDAEDELLHLVFSVARRLALEELRTDPEHALAAVRQALRELPAQERGLTIQVHPEEHGFITEQLGTEVGDKGWSVVADAHLTPGGCIVTTETSRVDATVERRLDAVGEQLLGDAHAGEGGEAVQRSYRGRAPGAEEDDTAGEAGGEGAEAPAGDDGGGR